MHLHKYVILSLLLSNIAVTHTMEHAMQIGDDLCPHSFKESDLFALAQQELGLHDADIPQNIPALEVFIMNYAPMLLKTRELAKQFNQKILAQVQREAVDSCLANFSQQTIYGVDPVELSTYQGFCEQAFKNQMISLIQKLEKGKLAVSAYFTAGMATYYGQGVESNSQRAQSFFEQAVNHEPANKSMALLMLQLCDYDKNKQMIVQKIKDDGICQQLSELKW